MGSSSSHEPTGIASVTEEVITQSHDGLLYHWGPQAWIDMFMSRRMIVEKAGQIIVYTFLPVLRLLSDPEKIDLGWEHMKSRREKVRLFDSPRERWRKHYGNFVREAEWALLELRKHLGQPQYEELVIGTAASGALEFSPGFVKRMRDISKTKVPKQAERVGTPSEPSRRQKLMFEMFNPAGFLTGPAEIREYDAANGSMQMYIPDCAWHVCGPAERLPNPAALPEEGCLLICKGSFERLFNQPDGALSMEFEPHLPETSCTVRMRWKPGSAS
ncbi:MAG: hypothetical protein GY772_08335 [bacterium]|nr:hypothetical protein [bacterium]MDP7298808.1 hypothetical protein [Myxococcota bacterium]